MLITDLKLPLTEKEFADILRKHKVTHAKIFGSYARGEQRPDSDLDLYIECKSGTSLFDIFDLQEELEKLTGVKMDLVTKINPNFAEYIEPDFVDLKV